MPEWREDPRPAFQQFQGLFGRAQARWAGRTEGELRDGLLEPALETLGFRAEVIKAADDDSPQPDYELHCAADDLDGPVCLCLTYPWARSLDGKDYTRDSETPEENPGARVVSLLHGGDVPFAIVTNGKLWRLYSSKTHSMSSRFYQLDLQETLAADDPSEAFRYFWLVFRARAFEPRTEVVEGEEQETCFAAHLIDQSQEYAKRLGERLKDRVFEKIFPHFAEGFIAYICAQQGRDAGDLTEDELQEVYRGTLTLLYRLLFLLYAESRDLLPVRETRGYWDVSLTKIKQEIADKAGTILDETQEKLKRAYSATETTLYERLQRLCQVVDKGERALNVPVYNGGLFITDPDPDEQGAEAATARFLRDYRIPDRYLSLGLDLMARDLDEKTQALVFIDYKSLGVRQLGSIYEGLLEFKVRVAEQNLCVVKEKGSYRYKPRSELTRAQREKLTNARATTVQKGPRKGDVYLENDKRERKATGSYYTPDYIVEYIVEHTVGPVLEEKFAAVRPKLRNAEMAHAANKSRIDVVEGYSREDAAREAYEKHKDVVDELFDVKVLDPAMGSGHFLVETVDFITDRMIDFLNAFPWNPVRELLEQTRRTIQDEMDEQEVNIDPGRLTDVNLLKRHVLKRCVYGVDLNPMAVELAKVSLWLDCFTLGAPLSFLDHHLRCGNSLIGTDVEAVESQVETKKGVARQMGLWRRIFEGLARAKESRARVGKLTDTTMRQLRESREQYTKGERDVAPYKGLLDVWASEWLGNTSIQDIFKIHAEAVADAVNAAVRRHKPHGDIPAEVREGVDRAFQFAERRRFFHWDLEFPEACSADVKSGLPAFDAVIGNPPYDVLAEKELGYDISQEMAFYGAQRTYGPSFRGKENLYKLFICRGLQLVAQRGAFSFIVPMALLGDDQAADVRRALLEDMSLRFVETFPQKDDPRRRVFPEAKLATAVFVSRATQGDRPFELRTHAGRYIEDSSPRLRIKPTDLHLFDPERLVIPSCTQRDWDIAVGILGRRGTCRLGDYVVAYQGEVNETTDGQKGFISTDPTSGPQILRGSNICMYALRGASQGEPIYLRRAKFLDGKPNSDKARHHQQRRVGWQESCPQNNFRRLIAAPVPRGNFCNHKINYVPEMDAKVSLDLLLALLNSQVLDWYFRLGSTSASVSHYQLYALPAPAITEDDGAIAWQREAEGGGWQDVREALCEACQEPGTMPAGVAEALADLSRRIQDVEAARELESRAERSRLAPESQPIQDVIDAVLFKCYGISDDDAAYIERRLQEML